MKTHSAVAIDCDCLYYFGPSGADAGAEEERHGDSKSSRQPDHTEPYRHRG
jgi:hypothetical protein